MEKEKGPAHYLGGVHVSGERVEVLVRLEGGMSDERVILLSLAALLTLALLSASVVGVYLSTRGVDCFGETP